MHLSVVGAHEQVFPVSFPQCFLVPLKQQESPMFPVGPVHEQAASASSVGPATSVAASGSG